MKYVLLLLIISPLCLWAQMDLPKPFQTDSLKPINSELVPVYYQSGYGYQYRSRYMYDGLDVRHAKDLGKYIMASGDPDAIREFKAYITSRHVGGWLIAGGILSMIIGTPILLSNRPNADGKFYTTQPYQCPAGYYCGTTAGSTVRVPDTQRQNSYGVGSTLLLSGAILAGIGWGLCLPGKHLRWSVQHYNRALKQRGISWQLTPYSSFSNAGLGLTGRF